MGLRDWIVEKLNPAQASIATQEISAPPTNIVDFEQAYREIDIINRSVDIIISGCADTPFEVDGALAKKFDRLVNHRPNPFENRNSFFRRAFLDFMVDGNTFFYYDKDEGSLYILPANSVEIIPDEKTFVKGYDYLITSDVDMFTVRRRTKEKTVISFTPDEIIHIKNDSVDSIYRGQSRLGPLERSIELYYSLTNFQRQFFRNNAVPGFVLTTDNVLSPKVKERLLDSWRMNYTSIFEGARSPAILDGGLKIDKFSNVNFQELDFENSIERLQQDMAKGLGVPFVLLKSGNNANIGSNQVLFYKHTIIPILNRYASAFESFFGDNIEFRPDEFSVPALQPDLRSQSNYYSTLVNTGIITVNEAREKMRFVKLEDKECDHVRIPQNITGSATNPSVGGRPTSDSSDDDDTDEA